MKRLFLALTAIALAAGCTRNPEVQPPAQLASVAYKNAGPTSLTLYTVVNRRTGAGAHTALEVNASETVLFDPAGSFEAQNIVRSGDVLYGFSPAVEAAYTDVHARTRFLVTKVNVPVPPDLAEMALQAVKTNGPVGAALCAQSTSQVLRSLPGFENIRTTYYPRQLEEQFSTLPGARSEEIIQND